MKKIIEELPEIKLVGITARTSNALEFDPKAAQIGKTMQRFFTENLQEKIQHRKNPNKVFAVYTNYESNENGSYTYFLGQEVTAFGNQSDIFQTLVIPNQTYTKFTSNPGKIPKVVINMWQNIWQMKEADFEGKRSYISDFEVYDERSTDLNSAIVDVFVGIKSYIV
jgi:predicted transcriptional regulator YdeE